VPGCELPLPPLIRELPVAQLAAPARVLAIRTVLTNNVPIFFFIAFLLDVYAICFVDVFRFLNGKKDLPNPPRLRKSTPIILNCSRKS
jgi:hypothetical protein